MLNCAVLTNDSFIVCSRSLNFYEGEVPINCNAIMMIFVKSKESEMAGGTLYVDGCPGYNEVSMIIAAHIAKVVVQRDPITSEELCALEALKEKGVKVEINPAIIL